MTNGKLNSIVAQPGLHFVRVYHTTTGLLGEAGDTKHDGIVAHSIELATKVGEHDEVRVLFGEGLDKVAVAVLRGTAKLGTDPQVYAAVCFDLGTPAVKSLKRAMRRLLKSYVAKEPKQVVATVADEKAATEPKSTPGFMTCDPGELPVEHSGNTGPADAV